MSSPLQYRYRLEELEANWVRDLRATCSQLQKEGRALFDLSMVNPDFAPSRELLDRFIESSLKMTSHRYTSARGLIKLRSAFVEKYSSAFGVSDLDPSSNVCVTLGAKDATTQVLSILAEDTDRVLLPSPTYPALHSSALLVGGYQVSCYPVGNENETIKAASQLMRSYPGSLLVLNFPNNPTGLTISSEGLLQIVATATETGCFVYNDFVYGEMGYERSEPVSVLSVAPRGFERVLEVYSMSKAYCVPGWRVAGLVGDPSIVDLVGKRKSHTDYGTFAPLQVGAAAGLRAGESILSSNIDRISARAGVVVAGLEECGFEATPPQAGAAVWAKLPSWCPFDSSHFAQTLAKDFGVVVLPGDVFGKAFSSHIRVALVRPRTVLSECVDRIRELMEGLQEEKAQLRSDSSVEGGTIEAENIANFDRVH